MSTYLGRVTQVPPNVNWRDMEEILQAAETAEVTEVSAMPPVPPEKMNILVVDDEAMIRDLLSINLRNEGHTVETASNGEEGLQRFKEKKFDLVFTDKKMPRMDGNEFVKAIRGITPFIPVVFSSGTPNEIVAIGTARLDKPYTKEQLLKAITQAFEQAAQLSKVLLVGEDLEGLKDHLSRKFNVTLVESPDEGLERFKQENFVYVVTTHQSPVLARAMKHANPNSKIMLLSEVSVRTVARLAELSDYGYHSVMDRPALNNPETISSVILQALEA